VTAIQPPIRYGVLMFKQRDVMSFEEKPEGEGGWINGGFFVLSPGAIDYIDGDETMWEHAPLRRLVRDGQLSAFRHNGFWQCMDTLRDKMRLEAMWASGSPPWKVW
jgi:glucose-1-phosphate cytidylyltransferase